MIDKQSTNPISHNISTKPENTLTAIDVEQLRDSLTIFDFLTQFKAKEDGEWGFFYNNCNGLEVNNLISTYIQQKRDKITYNYLKDNDVPTKLDSLLQQMKLWDTDVIMLSETCVAWEERIPRRVIQSTTQRYESNACWTAASSKLSVSSYVKPGGTSIVSLGRSSGTLTDQGTDPWQMGRWSYIVVSGKKEGVSLLVITGYRPGKRCGSAGPKTTWTQQTTLLAKEGRDKSPHEAFFTDLAQWLEKFKTEDMEILVWLDANENWSTKSATACFATQFDLHNINSEMNLPDTHPNIANMSRSTTIDFGLCTSKVLECITYVSATAYDLDTLGNHRGVLFDINMEALSIGSRNQDTKIDHFQSKSSCEIHPFGRREISSTKYFQAC